MPQFSAPSNWKDTAKIAAFVQERENEFLASLANKLYTGTFDEVRIYDQKSKDTSTFKYRAPDSGKSAVCLAIRSWLLKRHPEAWPHSTDYQDKPEAIFVGHDMRTFVKMLGIECSLPANQPQLDGKPDPRTSNALPLGMWYGQTHHRDIFDAVNPKAEIPWSVVLDNRAVAIKGWDGPGVNVEQDLAIATQFAAQLGMFLEE
jgi:hypothetical protein